MADKRTKNRKKLRSLLRDLFQFDHADLDFGIYRIMNEKRDEVERFIEHDLLDVVDEALARFKDADREQLVESVEERRQAVNDALGSDVIDASGQSVKYHDAPVVQRYVEALSDLERAEVAAETEARVFNDLWRFFSRYYDQGDFLTERRYSSRGAKYCVPYNGEEVMLHWANRDQYYVKTSERFTDYRFNAGPYTVWFRLVQANVPQDNVRGDSRYFVLHEAQPITYDEEARTLVIPFAYRPLSEEEEAHYLDVYNAQQSKSNRRKTLDRSVLCAALETEILEELDQADLKAVLAAVPEGKETSALGRHLNRYTARHTMDYFVHKDLGGFLRRELDVFLKTEVMHLGDLVSEESGDMAQHVLTRMRVVRQIAHRIIDFLAQMEDFQKRLFEKRKFVVQTDYCITLDQVPEDLYPQILANEAQLDAWRELYAIDEWPEDLFWQGRFDEAFLEHHPYLMIDTAFCDQDFKARLLAAFDDLDGATDGILIHGENFQALNLLQEKYSGRVKCIYIDPPYNTGNDQFLYKDRYRHSWLSMMQDRLDAGWGLLRDDGTLFISIDGNELEELSILAELAFGSRSHLNTFVWINNLKGRQIRQSGAAGTHEYVLAYGKDGVDSFTIPTSLAKTSMPSAYRGFDYEIQEDDIGEYVVKNELYNTNSKFNEETRPNLVFNIYWNPDTDEIRFSEIGEQTSFDGFIKISPKENNDGVHDYHAWRWSRGKIMEEAHNLQFDRSGDRVRVYTKVRGFDTTALKDVITDIPTDAGTRDLAAYLPRAFFGSYPKPTELVPKILIGLAEDDDFVLDYFAGSGTTAEAVVELNRSEGGNRRFILVEIGDYFNSVLKPRVQKITFSDNWSEGVPQNHNGMSHMVKYQRIESYEDALNNICVQQREGGQLELLRQFDDYMLHYMLDFETRDSPSLLAQEAFEKPFDYTLKIQQGHESPEVTTVDLVETFHYLIGVHVRRLEQYQHQGRTYVVSRGEMRTERGIEHVVTIWRDTEGLDLEEEADWVNADVLTDLVDRVYVNGYENFIDNAEPTEITFRARMEGDQ